MGVTRTDAARREAQQNPRLQKSLKPTQHNYTHLLTNRVNNPIAYTTSHFSTSFQFIILSCSLRSKLPSRSAILNGISTYLGKTSTVNNGFYINQFIGVHL